MERTGWYIYRSTVHIVAYARQHLQLGSRWSNEAKRVAGALAASGIEALMRSAMCLKFLS
jgi:hypothetical protein